MGVVQDAAQAGEALRKLGLDTDVLGDPSAPGHSAEVEKAAGMVRDGVIPAGLVSVIQKIRDIAGGFFQSVSGVSSNVNDGLKTAIDAVSKNGDSQDRLFAEAFRCATTAEERRAILEASERATRASNDTIAGVAADANDAHKKAMAIAAIVSAICVFASIVSRLRR